MAKAASSNQVNQLPWHVDDRYSGVWAGVCFTVAFFIFAMKALELALPLLPRQWQTRAGHVSNLRKTVAKCPPEAVALLVSLALVVVLRAFCPTVVPEWARKNNEGAEVWKDIQNDWPILNTADTLLALQGFIRPLIVFLALWRMPRVGGNLTSPQAALTPEATWFYMVAMVGRCIAFPLSGDDNYMIVGPAGGVLPAAADAVTLTLLFCLALRQGMPVNQKAVIGAMVLSLAVAGRNHMRLANKRYEHADVGYAMAQMLELMASLCHVIHAAMSPLAPGATSVTVLLVLQQLLSAYFFVSVFPLSSEIAQNGKGHGYLVVTGGSVAQLGILLVAMAVNIARWVGARRCAATAVKEESPKQRRRRKEDKVAADMPLLDTGDEELRHCRSCEPAPEPSPEPAPEPAPPQLVSDARGEPIRCRAFSCRVHDEGLMYVGEELLEVLCSEGCSSPMHARCFRAASRAVRQRCSAAGCGGKVLRFRAADDLLEGLAETFVK